MKTKNNVQKAVLKSVAVLTSLVLLSYNLSAQGLWEQVMENTSASFAMLFDVPEAADTKVESTALYALAYDVIENDAELEMESWMTNAKFFATDATIAAETESAMQLENWMTTENFGMEAAFIVENEAALEVEEWMVDEKWFETEKESEIENKQKTENQQETVKVSDDKVYTTTSFVYRELQEPKLKFEAWMFDSNHFKITE